ncbi:MAG: GNAT family N-acetyltransferase [bacterium]
MIQLADEFFAAKHDPNQISVDETVVAHLQKIHPKTVSEEQDENGPIAWMLIIPTTYELMEQFIEGELSEQELLTKTPLNAKYDALYLCSALVLPEHRSKGLAKRMLSEAISAIKNDHPLRALFYWSFSFEGDRLVKSVAHATNLPLFQR